MYHSSPNLQLRLRAGHLRAILVERSIELLEAFSDLLKTEVALGDSERASRVKEQAISFYPRLEAFFPSLDLTDADERRLKSRLRQIQANLDGIVLDSPDKDSRSEKDSRERARPETDGTFDREEFNWLRSARQRLERWQHYKDRRLESDLKKDFLAALSKTVVAGPTYSKTNYIFKKIDEMSEGEFGELYKKLT